MSKIKTTKKHKASSQERVNIFIELLEDLPPEDAVILIDIIEKGTDLEEFKRNIKNKKWS